MIRALDRCCLAESAHETDFNISIIGMYSNEGAADTLKERIQRAVDGQRVEVASMRYRPSSFQILIRCL